MQVFEILTFLAATAMLAIVTAGTYLGMMALTGAVWLVRCNRCDHLTVVHARATANTCLFCRHERVLHPLHTRHVHAPHPFQR